MAASTAPAVRGASGIVTILPPLGGDTGGDQQAADLRCDRADGVGLVIRARPAHVDRRGVVQEFLLGAGQTAIAAKKPARAIVRGSLPESPMRAAVACRHEHAR